VSEGTHTFYVKTVDQASNDSSSISITIEFIRTNYPEPIISIPTLNIGNILYVNVSNIDISFSGPSNINYSISGLPTTQILIRNNVDIMYGTINNSGIVLLNFNLNEGLNIIDITFNPGLSYSRIKRIRIFVNTTLPTIFAVSKNTVSFIIPAYSTYNIYTDDSTISILGGQSTYQPIILSTSNLSSGYHTFIIIYVDSIGNNKTYSITIQINSGILTYAPPPNVRTDYLTQSERIKRVKKRLAKCCVHPNQTRKCKCKDISDNIMSSNIITLIQPESVEYSVQPNIQSNIQSNIQPNVQPNNLIRAPPPKVRINYPTQSQRTEREKRKIEQCCVHSDQERKCKCTDLTTNT
jgi:hypothetical protein